MPAAPIPNSESQRLEALVGCRVLDSAPEPHFDDLTRLAAEICDTPIALVSLVDSSRQWFKSKFGLEADETPRDQAFCAYAILDDVPFIINDATKDSRTADNPLVTCAPFIRFYAGVPLHCSGERLGTLCVIDTKTRDITAKQLRDLEALARQCSSQLELRSQLTKLQKCSEKLKDTNTKLQLAMESEQKAHAKIELAMEAEKSANAELQRAIESEKAANEAKTQFLSNMSHELRTPLTAVLGYADILGEALTDQPDLNKYIKTIKKSGDLLLHLLNEILDLSKIEAGKLEVEHTRVSPRQILTDLSNIMRVVAKKKGIDLTMEYHDEVPNTINTDETRFKQILLNLIGNAIKFTPSEGRVCVQMRLLATEEKIEVKVIDDGPGINEQDLEHVLEPFSQADSSIARTHGGTGLGLPIAKRLAVALGGSLTLQSKKDVGTTCVFTIATGKLLSKSGMTKAKSEDAVMPSVRQKDKICLPKLKGSVLVADDSKVNRKLITIYLRQMGLDVTTVENGAEAFDLVQVETFDAVLMDLQMPIMDGIASTKAIREFGISIPIIALTANAFQDCRDVLDSGFQAFLTKPIDKFAIAKELKKYVPASSSRVVSSSA